jgi:hypothetical protein
VAPERIWAKFAEIRQQLKINAEIIKRDHPDPKPTILPHVVEIITGHVEDRLRELEAMIPTNITAARVDWRLLRRSLTAWPIPNRPPTPLPLIRGKAEGWRRLRIGTRSAAASTC